MSIVSYAQNFEDVMLWRALKHIEKGFFVDVGAWSPDLDSVTRLFYEHGWYGINIEPNPEFYSYLKERRPRDINLRFAVSDEPGSLEMNFLSNPGLSTLDDDIAKEHKANGWDVNRQSVKVVTLAEIWINHIPSGHDVHFLKIDVEGLEAAVIKGNDWTCYRPWIVVVEATLPMSQEESHGEWENILLSADYQFAYADGLNRFYLAKEHSELLSSFKYPPNVFDEFLLYSQKKAGEQAQLMSDQLKQATSNLQVVYNSCSWRITKPLRWFSLQLRLVKQYGVIARVKLLAKKIARLILQRIVVFVSARPSIHQRCVRLVRRLGLYGCLRRISGAFVHTQQTNVSPMSVEQLSPSAHKIYVDLKAIVMTKDQKDNR